MVERPSRLLRQVIERNLLEVRVGASEEVDLVRCRRARWLSGASPAAVIGLRKDDLLVAVDGVEVHETPWFLYRDPAAEREYRFVRRRDGRAVTVRATGIDLGAEWALTLEGLVRRWDPLPGDVTDLLDLWRVSTCEPLQGLAWMRCMRTRTASGLLSRFRRLEDPDTPAVVLLGASSWEQGWYEQGASHIASWLEAHDGDGPPEIAAIAWLCAAREEHRIGQRLRAIRAVRRALQHAWLEPAAALLAEWTGDVVTPPRGRWQTEAFPAAYVLPALDADPSEVDGVSFEAALSDLQPHQVLLIVVLGRERGNAVYDELMFRYVNFATWLPDLLASLHAR